MREKRRREILRYLGFSGQEMPASLKQRIDGAIDACYREQRPSGIYLAYPISIRTDSDGREAVFVEGTVLVLRGESIVEYMRGATSCVLMAVTLGLASERALRTLGAKSVTDQAVYSCVCSDIVECAADDLESQIAGYARDRGLHAKKRYSPGYGDFSIDIHADFVRVLRADRRLGIYVTQGGMLVPSKSITAVVGLFPEPPEGAKLGCDACACREHCVVRESGETCYKGTGGPEDDLEPRGRMPRSIQAERQAPCE